MVSTYIYADSFDDFAEQAQEIWEQKLGYQLVDVEEIGDNAWTGVFKGNTRGNSFDRRDDFAALEEAIETQWDSNFDLVDLDYVDDTWIAVFDKNFFANRGSSYSRADSIPEFAELAEEQWSKGFNLTNVEYADNTWVSIYRKDLTQTAYSTTDSLTGLKSIIAKRRGQGYDLIGVEYGDDTWVGVFGKDPYNSTKYAIAEDITEFMEKFEQRREQGDRLIDYEQVEDGLLFGIYEQSDSGSSGFNESLDNINLALALI